MANCPHCGQKMPEIPDADPKAMWARWNGYQAGRAGKPIDHDKTLLSGTLVEHWETGWRIGERHQHSLTAAEGKMT